MVDVYVGGGSNVDPRPNLQRAIGELTERFGSVTCSAAYRSPPYGFSGADFLNIVIAFDTEEPPDAVVRALKRIESDRGRSRQVPRFSSRSLDLDLLLYGRMVDAARRLPRDDVCRYPFVLAPLAELAPHLIHPLTGRTMADEWRARDAGPELIRVGPLSAALAS